MPRGKLSLHPTKRVVLGRTLFGYHGDPISRVNSGVPAGEHLFLDMLAISFACSALISPSPALLSPSMALLSPSPARLAPAAAHRSTTVRCSLAFERVESAKACAIAAGEYFRIRTRAPCCSLLTSVSSNLNSRSRRRCRVSTRQTLDALGIRGKVVDGHE